jgi:hypothetical protein
MLPLAASEIVMVREFDAFVAEAVRCTSTARCHASERDERDKQIVRYAVKQVACGLQT